MASSKQTLGQLHQFYVLGKNTPPGDVTTDQYNDAANYFTQAFGVRITDRRDMDSLHRSYFHQGATLDQTVTDYYQWPQHDDIPQPAVQRAALLANFWTYNGILGSWTPDAVQSLPYVAPIPSLVYGGTPTPAPVVAGTTVVSTPYTVSVNPAALDPAGATLLPGGSAATTSPAATAALLPAAPVPGSFMDLVTSYWWIPAGILGIGLIILVVKKRK